MVYWYLPLLTLPYFILLLYLYRYLLRIKIFRPVTDPKIFVSVVVACKNEQENLPGLLTRLAGQEYPPESCEIIIVDDHSTDKTIATAGSYKYHLNLKVIVNEGKGKKHALKTGIEAAGGDLIITTDADCLPGSRWLSTIVSFFEHHKPDMIIGPVKSGPGKGFPGKFQELDFLSLQAVTAGAASANNAVMCNGANLAFTKTAYLKNMNSLRFDIATGDDVFLLHGMKRQKSLILWLESPWVLMETKAPPDLKSFLEQRKRWASKSTAYRDGYSIFVGIVTFVTNLTLAGLLAASVFQFQFFKSYLIAFAIKSIPDFLLLLNTTKRYGRKKLMWWFLPCQVIYPFYVMIVAGMALLPHKRQV